MNISSNLTLAKYLIRTLRLRLGLNYVAAYFRNMAQHKGVCHKIIQWSKKKVDIILKKSNDCICKMGIYAELSYAAYFGVFVEVKLDGKSVSLAA